MGIPDKNTLNSYNGAIKGKNGENQFTKGPYNQNKESQNKNKIKYVNEQKLNIGIHFPKTELILCVEQIPKLVP